MPAQATDIPIKKTTIMKRVNLKLFLMALALPIAITLSSCGPDKPEPAGLPDIQIEDGYSHDLTFAFDELTAKSVKIVSNRAWTANVDAEWLKVTPASEAEGTYTVEVLMLSENKTGADRTTVVTFNNGSTKDAVLNVKQTKEVVGPNEGLTEFSETFESGTDGQKFEENGWINVMASGDRTWAIKTFSNNKYIQATAHGNNTSGTYEMWLITPALDIATAANKTMQFVTAAGYFVGTTTLEVFVMDAADPSANKVKIENARLVQQSDLQSGQTYTDFIPSGSIDLSSYGGIKHIGFRYVAEGGPSNSTTYQLDNFMFGIDGMPLSFGEPALSGIFMQNTPIDGAKITIPYQNASGNESYTVSVAVSGAAAAGINAVANQTLTTTAGNGSMTIDITGTPTATGEFTLTLSGIEGLSTTTFNGTVQAQSDSPNLLLNPSFELFGDAIPDSWTQGGDPILTPVTADVKDGSIALKMEGNSAGTGRLEQTIEGIVPGKTYNVSFWYRNNTKTAAASGIRIWSCFYTSSIGDIPMNNTTNPELRDALQPTTTLEAVTEWTLYSVTVTAPANATKFNFGIRATKTNYGEFDNLTFKVVE